MSVIVFGKLVIESRHTFVGNRQGAGLASLQKKWDHASTTSHDVAISDDRKKDVPMGAHIVGSDEELVETQFGGAIEVDGSGGFVRA